MTNPTYCYTPDPRGPILCVLCVAAPVVDKAMWPGVRLVLGYGATREAALGEAMNTWHGRKT